MQTCIHHDTKGERCKYARSPGSIYCDYHEKQMLIISSTDVCYIAETQEQLDEMQAQALAAKPRGLRRPSKSRHLDDLV
jgi:hypothetical protein